MGGLLLGGPPRLPALAAAGALGVQGLLSQAQQATDPVQAERLLQEDRSSLLATETQLEQQLTQLQQEAESWQKLLKQRCSAIAKTLPVQPWKSAIRSSAKCRIWSCNDRTAPTALADLAAAIAHKKAC